MTDRRLCLLTPSADYPNPWVDERDDLIERLHGAGLAVTCLTWDEAEAAALTGYDLVLPLLAWPYVMQPERWFALLDAWQQAGVPMYNPPALLRWNSDKAYLAALSADGIGTVPTLMTHALDDAVLAMARDRFNCTELVVKPPVSAGAIGTYRLDVHDPVPAEVAGQAMLVQPLMPAISSEGEYSLFLFDGTLSHAIIKRPAAGEFRVQAQFGGREASCAAPDGALDLAGSALATACRLAGVAGPPLYARVDLVRDSDGALLIMELEMIEPSLFLHFSTDGGGAFTAAVANRAGSAG